MSFLFEIFFFTVIVCDQNMLERISGWLFSQENTPSYLGNIWTNDNCVFLDTSSSDFEKK